MQKQRDRPTQAEMSDAPEIAVSEASNEFLNRLIQGSFAMNTTVSPNESQANQLALAGYDLSFSTVDNTKALASILNAICRLTQDETIQGLAIHGKDLADIVRIDAEGCLDLFESARTWGVI